MNTLFQSAVVGTIALFALTLNSAADAQQPTTGSASAPPVAASVQALGFAGHFVDRAGMVVDRVQYGTPAWRIGLTKGDIVQEINGKRLNSQAHYYKLLQESPFRVRLTVVDARTGRPAHRQVVLRAPFEPHEVEAYTAGVSK